MPMARTITREYFCGICRKNFSAEVAAGQRDDGHRYRETPIDNARDHEWDQGDAVDRHRKSVLDRVLRVEVRQPGERKDGEHHDAHAGSEIAAVDRYEELDDELPHGMSWRVAFLFANQPGADRENGRGEKQQPGNEAFENRRWREEQRARADEGANDADGYDRQQKGAVFFDLFFVAARAPDGADPHRAVVRCVGRDGRHAGEDQRGEREKAAAAGHAVHRPGGESSDRRDGDLRGSQSTTCRPARRVRAW